MGPFWEKNNVIVKHVILYITLALKVQPYCRLVGGLNVSRQICWYSNKGKR